MDADKLIRLTDVGREAAEQIVEKHRVIKACLIALGVPDEIAEKDACWMEHRISPQTLERMKCFLDRENPDA